MSFEFNASRSMSNLHLPSSIGVLHHPECKELADSWFSKEICDYCPWEWKDMQSLWSATSALSSYDVVWCRWSYQDIQRWKLPSEWMRLHIWSGHAIWHTHPLWPNTRPPLTLNLSTWSWLAWKNRYCFSFIHPVSAAPHNCLYHIVWNETRALSFVGQIYNVCNFKDCYLSFFSMKEECVTIITVFGFHCISALGPLIQMLLGQQLHECVSVWTLLLIAWTGPENEQEISSLLELLTVQTNLGNEGIQHFGYAAPNSPLTPLCEDYHYD